MTGNSVSELDTVGTNAEILFETNGNGMLALVSFRELPPPSECSLVTETGVLAVMALRLVGRVFARRRRGR